MQAMYRSGIIFVAVLSAAGAAIATCYGTAPLKWLIVGMEIIIGVNAMVGIRRAQHRREAAN